MKDPVNPSHYKSHPSGIECITITEHMSKNLGCAVDYIWRFPYTHNLTDLEKAKWYIEREIARCSPRRLQPFVDVAPSLTNNSPTSNSHEPS